MADTFASFSAKLDRFTSRLQADMSDAAVDASEVVAAEARRRVPVRTGRLRGGITARKTPAGGQATVVGVPYAIVVHNGSVVRNIRAQPFLTDAADATQREATRRVDKAVDASVKKAGL